MKQLQNFGIRIDKYSKNMDWEEASNTWDKINWKADKDRKTLTTCPNCKTKLGSLGPNKGKYCNTCEEIW